MKITSAEFVCSVTKPAMFPKERFPEFVFVGRSNVGKSSLINCLLNRKGLAKTSSSPGKTQTINFYRINKRFYFVDLPGYGYAKVPKEVRRGWKPMVEGYFSASRDLMAIITLFDIRRDMSGDSLALFEWLESLGIPIVVVLTKSDKLSRRDRGKQFLRTKTFLQEFECDIVMFSALKGEGKDLLWKAIINRYD
ncbi:MAG: ribosome biogenesis GTP-binding protein YihA/YsxC [Thermodesulfobacteriota bacterium]